MPHQIRIDPLSCVPVHLECFFRGQQIGMGTGFIVNKHNNNFLVTNWHMVTGRHPDNNQPISNTGAADPDTMGIWYHTTTLGSWTRKNERLIDETTGEKKWIEHSSGNQVDVIALPISQHSDIKTYPLDLSLANTDLIISPSEDVSIIGFPYGIASSGKFPIWKTGNIASEIDLNYENKPVFLIDASTREGMSGAPVIARRKGIRQTSAGWAMGGGDYIRFLGIYSGRIRRDSDIGMVWKPNVINEIIPKESLPL